VQSYDRIGVVVFGHVAVSAAVGERGPGGPALTTRMPIARIVGYAINLAVRLARDPDAVPEPDLEIFAPELIIRDSTSLYRPRSHH
jgi:hypothetical protein